MENNILILGKASLTHAAEALSKIANSFGGDYLEAIDLLKKHEGIVLTTGVGKSGYVAQKLAATLTSTGKPALFLNPFNALHGDLGLVPQGGIMIVISYSGETKELLALGPSLRQRNTRIISITGYPESQLAQSATVSLIASVDKEACPLNLAPTTSVIAALGVADALSVGLTETSGYKAEDFAINHPAGSLGRRLTLTVGDLMDRESIRCVVSEESTFSQVLTKITEGRSGAVCVADNKNKLLGIITDGDIRRALQKFSLADIQNLGAGKLMTRSPMVTYSNILAAEALNEMELRSSQISVLPVVNKNNDILGIMRVHDIVRAGF